MLTFLEKMGKQILNIAKQKKRVGFVLSFIIVAIVVGLGVLIAPVARAESEIVAGLLQFFGEIFLTLAGWFIQGTLFVLKFIIEIASYNAYIQSGPVTLGWVLVRDVANMFFVIILMVIAFGTVLGLQQYEWQKLLVKFILAAILVNFSRVICGVIIDAAQVFMMTFISAVAATAGGNLISLFSLDKTLNMAQTTASESVTSWNVLASAIAGCAFAFTAMVVTGAYMAVLLGRVVSLWVLIILSPLAYILSVLPQGAKYASQWWSQFSNNVIVGPVIAFFLWLSFAVAGGANVHNEFASAPYAMDASKVETETGAVSANENVVGGLSEIMKWDNMASFIIAIALMLAGVKVAKELGTAGSGALGAAAGAAGKFAMVASGAAAARWAVGKAAEGAKAAGKGIAMKMPVVGGEAWKRRGQAIGARAAMVGQKIQTLRDVGAKKLEKKGFFGAIGGKLIESGARKEKRVEFLKKAVESQKKIREDLWGAGVTPEGKLAGKMLQKGEIVHEEAERDKRNALAGVKADLLQEEGRHEEADAVRANDAAIDLKELADRTAGLNESQLKTLAANIASERDKMLSRIGELASKGKTKDADKIRESMNARGGINDRARGLMLSAMQKGHSTFNAVEGTLAKNFSGTTGSEDASLRFLSAMTGRDAKKDANAANAEFEGSMSGAARNAYLKNVQSLGLAMKKDGDAAPALIVASGREIDENGRQRLAYGVGSGVGKFDSDGKARVEGARNVAGIDSKMLGFVAPKVEFREAADAEVLLARDRDKNVAGWDNVNIKSFRDRMKGAKTSAAVTNAASLSLRNQMNTDAGITPEMARELLSDLALDMKDNKEGFREFMRQYEGLREKAGIGNDEKEWGGYHADVVKKAGGDAEERKKRAEDDVAFRKMNEETLKKQAQRRDTEGAVGGVVKEENVAARERGWRAEDAARAQARGGGGTTQVNINVQNEVVNAQKLDIKDIISKEMKVDAKTISDDLAEQIRKKIDQWNKADNKDYFKDQKQIMAALRQIREGQ